MQPPHVIFIDLTYGILVVSDSYGVPYSCVMDNGVGFICSYVIFCIALVVVNA